ncbi:hypothetical protein [Tepidicaulis sp.]|uniref:SLOG domain-containing protein n=1 Tax=Tepidicaulis sp. TaxID=1920809 RepID=UPI003B58B6C7
MTEAIFLSASVPDPRRGSEYAKTADAVAIQAAVSALVYITLGRRLLIWGGHPAITPMIWVAAADMKIDYAQWVRLYQSRYFEDAFPEDNERFNNVIFSENVEGDREKSLLEMRRKMFGENQYAAAVFIGGMGGVVDEFNLFRSLQPNASIVPILSTGGAALELAKKMDALPEDLSNNLDYVSLLYRHLDISEQEDRFFRPNEQPADPEARRWKPPTP